MAFCDSNWGNESSTGRKSTSGGVIYIVAGSSWYCVKGYSRLQSVVALSSAEAELFAIAEAAKEVSGLGQLASHIWGELTKPLAIYTDSASARQIAGMEGFLRRMRHVDIRLCFIQAHSFAYVAGVCLEYIAVCTVILRPSGWGLGTTHWFGGQANSTCHQATCAHSAQYQSGTFCAAPNHASGRLAHCRPRTTP